MPGAAPPKPAIQALCSVFWNEAPLPLMDAPEHLGTKGDVNAAFADGAATAAASAPAATAVASLRLLRDGTSAFLSVLPWRKDDSLG